MKNLYLFDFDGVIVDSIDLYEHSIRTCLETINRPIIQTREDFLDLFEENFYEAIDKKGVPLETFLRASASIISSLDYSQVRAFQKMKPVLERFSDTHFLVVITSNRSEMVEKTLRREHLDSLFIDILGADFMLSKTAKIAYAMNRWDKSPAETYYIGDTAGDIREAKSAGVHTVAVTWGWHQEARLTGAGAEYVVRTPEDLLLL